MNLDAMREQLIRHEGLRRKPYSDTVGKITIGVGRNLTDVGLSPDECIYLLDNDIDACVADLVDFQWFAKLDDVRQRAIVDLRFNLGPSRFRGFKKALAFMASGDYTKAAGAFRQSKWFQQVKSRGPRIVHMIATGTEP